MECAESFYKSRTWRKCKEAYTKSVGGLCERCLSRGVYNAGRIVHHKIYIGPENINDASVTLNFENLELLCRSCHELEHKSARRYAVVNGRVVGI